MNEILFKPIGLIHSPYTEAKGTPLQARAAKGARGTVELYEPFMTGLKDLEGFERIWLLYYFHKAPPPRLLVTPLLDSEERGVFSTRAPTRPNPIGMTPVRLINIEGRILHVEGIDVLDGTPLLDIKPYFPLFDSFKTSVNGWLDDSEVASRLGSGIVMDDRFSK